MSEKLESETPVATACLRLDAARLQWILDHVTNLECTEMVAGNQDRFFLPATREDIDKEMRGTSPILGQCACMNGMCGCLACPIHGMPKADAQFREAGRRLWYDMTDDDCNLRRVGPEAFGEYLVKFFSANDSAMPPEGLASSESSAQSTQ